MLKVYKKCRVCKCELHDIVEYGDFAVVGYMSDDENKLYAKRKSPLTLCRCDPSSDENACGLVQLRHSLPVELLYVDYYYRSSINPSMVQHLDEIVQRAIDLNGGDVSDIRVVDIGCNDGALIKSCIDRGINRSNITGFDPAKNLAKHSRLTGATIYSSIFDTSVVKDFKKFDKDAIFSIAMFYDLNDPLDFVRQIADCLSEKGIWVNEQLYLPEMIKNTAFDSICHEHVTYFSLSTFKNILDQFGLEIIDVHVNGVNGGSFQTYVSRKGAYEVEDAAFVKINSMLIDEFDLKMDTGDIYKEFSDNVDVNLNRVADFVRSELDAGKKIIYYGASTKGAITVQTKPAFAEINLCADRNAEKYGLTINGTSINIISEAEARALNPDYFFVLPWHFIDGFVEREKEFLDSGGKLIVPMPEARIIGASGVEEI